MAPDISMVEVEAEEADDAVDAAMLIVLLAAIPSAASMKAVTASCEGGLMTKIMPAD